MTKFACGACGRVAYNEEQAEACCLCTVCGKRPATDKTLAGNTRPDVCARCLSRQRRENARAAVAHAQRSVDVHRAFDRAMSSPGYRMPVSSVEETDARAAR